MRAVPVRRLGHAHRVARRHTSLLRKVAHNLWRDRSRRFLVLRDSKMEVAPIDANIVPRAIENVLIARTDREHVEVRCLVAEGYYLLAAVIDCDQRIDIDENGEAMRVPIGRFCATGKISDWP